MGEDQRRVHRQALAGIGHRIEARFTDTGAALRLAAANAMLAEARS